MLIDILNQRLAQAVEEFQASSCTFYIRDPHWIDEYRLVATTGVRRDESMYGFISPESARQVLADGEAEVYNTILNASDAPCRWMDEIPEDVRPLFVGFSEREGVRSNARFIHIDCTGDRQAILFLNFSEVREFDEPTRERLRAFFGKLIEDLPAIQQQLIKQDAEWIGQATKIASPAWSATNIDYNLLDKPDSYFNEVIGAVLRALGITPGTGLGTIHLYHAEERTLELRGSYGEIHDSVVAQAPLPLLSGKGIVSWVALRERALLIRDLARSDYAQINVPLNDAVQSELAVPLEVRGELIGVMCLECTEVNKFLPHHVRSVWYAANQVAVAYLLHQHASINRKLLELCWQATVGGTEARTSLNELARLVKEYLQASYCDIWCYNNEAHRYDLWGASFNNFQPHSRPSGWTDVVRRAQCPIWINDITGPSQYTISHWIADEWHDGAPAGESPKELNSVSIAQGIKGELAIPITIRNECVGIAWVKYRRAALERPTHALMLSALGFAAEAGLVLDSILRHEVDLKEKGSINHVGDAIVDGIKWRWKSTKTEIVDAYVISEPFRSKLGGDFFAKKSIDQGTVGILLVDGEGHGVEGALHMLPLMTAFESFWLSYSAAHVVSQLIKTSEEVGVRGTAIYCIVSLIEDKRWLCVTSAGHDSLVVFSKEQSGKWNFQYLPKFNGPILGSPLREPLMDHRYEISPGTIIVGYTDGVAEGGQSFDANRLATFVLTFLIEQGDDPASIAHAIMEKSREQQPNGLQDDATLFVLRVK
jgi:GAF domain-containing protein